MDWVQMTVIVKRMTPIRLVLLGSIKKASFYQLEITMVES